MQLLKLLVSQGEDLSPEGDKGIMREMQQEGEDYTMPNEGAEVTIRLAGSWRDSSNKDQKFFDEKALTYFVGEGEWLRC